MKFSHVFLAALLFLSLTAYAKQGGLIPGPEDFQTPGEGLDPVDDNDKVTPGSGGATVQPGGHTSPSEPSPAGERAMISGVPRYYQPGMGIWGACGGDEFPAGCGPVAGAAIAAWWERRGIHGLMTGGADSDGLPYDTIVELGTWQYMDRITGCDQTAVLPDRFTSGLQAYLNDHSSVDFTVTKYTLDENADFDSLWSMLKDEIDHGRPMVYLYRADGDEENDGFHYASHYAVVVGYDEQYGKRIPVIQANWGEGNWSTGYMNTYASDQTYTNNDYLEFGDFTRPAAAINYNLYTIRPDDEPDYSGECSGWLLTTTRFHGADPMDGVQSEYFKPGTYYLRDQPDWEETSAISRQDGICFVAKWLDEDGDGTYDDQDNCPGLYNDQNDSDGDGIGDLCDYAELQLRMGYSKGGVVRTDLGGNRTRLTFNLRTTLTNNGTDSIPAGTRITVHWSQEASEFGGGDSRGQGASEFGGGSANGTVGVSRGPSGMLAFSFGNGSGMAAAPYSQLGGNRTNAPFNPYSGTPRANATAYNPSLANRSAAPYGPSFNTASQTLLLSSDFEPGATMMLDDQRFTVVIDEGDCLMVTHSADLNESVDEFDEDNAVFLEGYNTLSDCYGVLDFDYAGLLESGEEPIVQDPGMLGEIGEAGLAQVMDRLRDVGPEGAFIDLGPVILDIPEDAVSGTVAVQVVPAQQRPPPMGVGSAYQIRSRGQFSKPVTLTFKYDESALKAREQSLSIFTYENGWTIVPSTVDVEADTVSASLSHFSVYALAHRQFSAERHVRAGEQLRGVENTTVDGKEAFRIRKARQARLLGIIPVEMEVETVVDSEDTVVEERMPWWAFLATD